MRTIGTLFTCDRCGKERFEEHVNADQPAGWAWENFLDVDLCSDCSSELDKRLKLFLQMDQYELDLTEEQT